MTRYRILAGLQVLDVTLTGVALHLGGAEQNALARYLTDLGYPGLLGLLTLKLSLVYLLARRQVPVNLASSVYAGVVGSNALFLGLYATGSRLDVNPFLVVGSIGLLAFTTLKLLGWRRAQALGAAA